MEEELEWFILWGPLGSRPDESYRKCDLRPYDVEVMGDALESNRWALNSGPVPSVGPASCAKPVTWGHEGITKLMPQESAQAYASCMVNSA